MAKNWLAVALAALGAVLTVGWWLMLVLAAWEVGGTVFAAATAIAIMLVVVAALAFARAAAEADSER